MREVNFDCIVGPTHSFSGLSLGNLASLSFGGQVSYPKKAALQGLNKMKLLHDLGIMQCVLPPSFRPNTKFLHNIGYLFNENTIDHQSLKVALSSSSMWAANVATICPSDDSYDKKVHVLPANLSFLLHRSIEAGENFHILKQVFSNKEYFTVHEMLPNHPYFGDEGAANHMRFSVGQKEQGSHVFVYGFSDNGRDLPEKYPARQSLMASKAAARLFGLTAHNCIFAKELPKAIDEGAFHNDVVAVSNDDVLLIHEEAWEDQKNILNALKEKTDDKLKVIEIAKEKLSLQEAVKSYLFNSQLLTIKKDHMLLLAPAECKNNQSAKKAIEDIIALHHPIKEVKYFDVSESMQNGGGPACLRLRAMLTQKEINALSPKIFFTNELYERLSEIIDKSYPNKISKDFLLSQDFINRCHRAVSLTYETLGINPLF